MRLVSKVACEDIEDAADKILVVVAVLEMLKKEEKVPLHNDIAYIITV
jgi:hypothetical protein